MGMGRGGGLAQRATISESGGDVIAIAMGPGRRHITKPVCEITYALREEGIDTSVLVLNAGAGVPADAEDVSHGQCMGLEPIEVERIQQFKVALIHLGNVRSHIIWKARLILRNVDIPAILVCQCPVDFEDFARIGIKTSAVMPKDENVKSKGTIIEIVNGVIRGVSCSQDKLDEIVSKVQKMLPEMKRKSLK
ncbi:MAG: methyl-coenzyme M reductase I operon protein C [archaeon]|nr:methyl-coenzyme M reductase I operon protein C [archaeon]